MLHTSGHFAGFIGDSSPRATVKGTRGARQGYPGSPAATLSRLPFPHGRRVPSWPSSWLCYANMRWWEQKGEAVTEAPRRPCSLGTPTKRYAYFVVDEIDSADVACSLATASAIPRKAAAV
jgi:hypothetical protein